jgi:enoyl-CoA hydratase/carnithine racemase
MPSMSQDGPVWTVDLGDDENRFSPDFLTEIEGLLDDIAASAEPAALVTTGSGRFYSNGLDLEWLGAHPEQHAAYVARVEAVFARVLTLPVPTVAAINGHAFGAGALIAMAHDHRVMRADRGFLCFPEVDIGLPFTPGMSALIQCKVTARTAVDAMTTGRRFGGEEAYVAGLVDAAVPLDDLAESAAARVRQWAGKDRTTLGVIKERMFAATVAALGERPA